MTLNEVIIVWKELILDFPHTILFLFSDLIFPDFSLTHAKLPDFLVNFKIFLTVKTSLIFPGFQVRVGTL